MYAQMYAYDYEIILYFQYIFYLSSYLIVSALTECYFLVLCKVRVENSNYVLMEFSFYSEDLKWIFDIPLFSASVKFK